MRCRNGAGRLSASAAPRCSALRGPCAPSGERRGSDGRFACTHVRNSNTPLLALAAVLLSGLRGYGLAAFGTPLAKLFDAMSSSPISEGRRVGASLPAFASVHVEAPVALPAEPGSGCLYRRQPAALAGAAAALLVWLQPAAGHTDVGYAIHAEGSAARMVGERKSEQFGWGGAGLLSPELTLAPWVGIELPLGVVGLSDGGAEEPGMEETGEGMAYLLTPGVRVRPFGTDGADELFQAAGLWLAAGGGLAITGDLARPTLEGRVGYDLAAGPVRLGPYGGYLQIIETDSELMPEDARIVLVGLHGSFEPRDGGAQVPVTGEAPAGPTDRDGDGILDGADACPKEPEDIDNYRDEDGCPDADNDGDSIPDLSDECPFDPEDLDGFEDGDGCPDRDHDRDGVANDDDRCPTQPEDRDGFQDADGCPDPDNDGDGILDDRDECDNEPETVNGYADEDGCPDEALVRVQGKEIVLDQRVYFRLNSSLVELRSWPLLGNVAKLIATHPEYRLIHVQGHADDSGDEPYNERLSVARGMAVRDMLVRFGVARSRLTVEGFGELRPADPGQTVVARRKNRRVELQILERTPLSGEATEAAAGEPDARREP